MGTFLFREIGLVMSGTDSGFLKHGAYLLALQGERTRDGFIFAFGEVASRFGEVTVYSWDSEVENVFAGMVSLQYSDGSVTFVDVFEDDGDLIVEKLDVPADEMVWEFSGRFNLNSAQGFLDFEAALKDSWSAYHCRDVSLFVEWGRSRKWGRKMWKVVYMGDSVVVDFFDLPEGLEWEEVNTSQ